MRPLTGESFAMNAMKDYNNSEENANELGITVEHESQLSSFEVLVLRCELRHAALNQELVWST